MLRRADQALSAAERNGGDQVVLWRPDGEAATADHLDPLLGVFTGQADKDYRNMRLLWDVLRALDLDSLPSQEEYETLAGFIMVMLRRVPRRTDKVVCEGYQFEVMDVDSYRIDQVMVSRITPEDVRSEA